MLDLFLLYFIYAYACLQNWCYNEENGTLSTLKERGDFMAENNRGDNFVIDSIQSSKRAKAIAEENATSKTDQATRDYLRMREEAKARAKSDFLKEINSWMRARDYYAQ